MKRAHDERLLRSSLAWSGKAPARLSAKNCRCSSTSHHKDRKDKGNKKQPLTVQNPFPTVLL